MSQPLASGLHLVILSGPGLSCYAVLDRHGVEELVAIEDPSRTKLKRLIRSIEEQHDVDLEMRFIEADANLVRSRICEALERHQTTGKPLPTDHVRVRQLLEDGISSDPHPVRKAIGSVTAQLVQQSSDLLGTLNASQYSPGAVDRPVFDEAWQTEMGQRLQNAAASPVVVDDDQRRDRIHQEIDRMVVDWFGHEERTWEAQRLLDSAYVLHQTRRSASAAIAVATADALLDQTVEALDIPWARDSVRGIVHVDALIQMSEGHVHGPDCQHDHDEMSEPKTDPKSTLIVPGNQMSEGHVHGPDCQHGHDEMSEPKTDPDSKLIVPGN